MSSAMIIAQSLVVITLIIGFGIQLGLAKCGSQTSCTACVHQREGFEHCRWCVADNRCHAFSLDPECHERDRITFAYDCPVPMRNGYEYSETFAKTKALPLSAAAYSDNPQACLTNVFSNATIKRQLTVHCDSSQKDTCSAFTAVSHTDRAIIASFRGTSGTWQLVMEGVDSIFRSKRNFPGGGKADEYFYNAFYSLWNAGMHQDLLWLKARNPGYKLWVTGHSLGGSMASLCSSLAVTLQMWPSTDVRMVTFGQPRTGDLNYAKAHDQRVYYSYRVVHKKDLVPHIPPKTPDNWFDGYYHHRFEVWYDNAMTPGVAHQLCTRADDDSCSNTQTDLSITDHLHYFNVDVSGFGENGCR